MAPKEQGGATDARQSAVSNPCFADACRWADALLASQPFGCTAKRQQTSRTATRWLKLDGHSTLSDPHLCLRHFLGLPRWMSAAAVAGVVQMVLAFRSRRDCGGPLHLRPRHALLLLDAVRALPVALRRRAQLRPQARQVKDDVAEVAAQQVVAALAALRTVMPCWSNPMRVSRETQPSRGRMCGLSSLEFCCGGDLRAGLQASTWQRGHVQACLTTSACTPDGERVCAGESPDLEGAIRRGEARRGAQRRAAPRLCGRQPAPLGPGVLRQRSPPSRLERSSQLRIFPPTTPRILRGGPGGGLSSARPLARMHFHPKSPILVSH